MENTNKTKYLSDVINYKQDIEPYQIIQIYSGVGSGKNTWVQKLANEGKSILFITSRKITAMAQADKMGAQEFIDLEKWQRNTISGKPVGNHQYLVSCTNAGLESFAKNKYDPDNSLTHIWNFFDLIVVDEAHSLVTDAAFASSSFHVWQFVLWVLKQEQCKCKVILMSGTPKPLDRLIPDELRNDKDFNNVNYYEKCNHVDPKEVIIHRGKSMAVDEIVGFFNEGKRIIYFTKRIRRIADLVIELNNQGIKDSDIGVSYSDKKRNNLFSDELVDKIKVIDDSIANEEKLPDDVKIFITNTKNKEGININYDDDIEVVMFTESTQRSELTQMAGRVRSGLDKLIIMTNLSNTEKYDGDDGGIDIWKRYLSEQLFEDIEKNYNTFIEKNDYPTPKKIIEDIVKCFSYINYDYFQNKLTFFKGKVCNEQLDKEDSEDLMDIIFRWNETEYIHDTHEIIYASGEVDFVKKWFPYSDVYKSIEGLHKRLPKPPTDKEIKEIIRAIVDGYLKEQNLIREDISPKEKSRDSILADLTTLIKEKIPNYKTPSQLGSLLKQNGYKLDIHGKKTISKYSICLLDNTFDSANEEDKEIDRGDSESDLEN